MASKKNNDEINNGSNPTTTRFPVVAIGASAGGIEAITRLSEFLPAKSGMAYVVIQHLSPHHESILPELIERRTKMKVYQATDGMLINPDCIYVIPPNDMMSIEDGHLISALKETERAIDFQNRIGQLELQLKESKEQLKMMLAEFNSIKEQLQTANERRYSEYLAKENEERLRLIIQNAFDIITIFSEKGDVIYESESIEEILGYKPTERIDKNVFNDAIVHPDDREKKELMFKNALANSGKDIKSEFRLLHKDGSYRVMEAVCINLLNNTKIKGILANYHDVTERRALEKQKEQFIGIASHELKTPVTSIKGYVQVLEEIFTLNGNTEALSMLKKMEGQIDRLTNLIKDLLDVTQISEGILKLKKSDFDLNELITEVITEIQPIALKHLIVTDLQPLQLINGDKEKLRQVLVNVLSNAIKYSPGGRKVEIRSYADEKSAVVAVKDYGIGMTDETQKKIFNRFFRDVGPAMSTFPGLGLGLYIASEILKVHGGNMWVKSTLNEGAEFFFSIPF
ncbi:MAG TPA: ATP-binding protein [Lacibacter sp.]|nr:ATP-binding protein [Lacibacter sp.]